MGFVKLIADDFCGFEHFELKLRKRGLVWLSGDNQDTESAASNGAGKSNVFKAIIWSAYGQSVDGEDGDQVIRDGAKCAKTQLWLDDGWLVVRERRRGSPKLYLFAPGGAQVEGSKDELQDRINHLIGMDFHTARNTILYAQDERERFVDKKLSDKDRKAILHNILRTALYGQAHEWVKAQNLEMKRAIDLQSNLLDKALARIAEHDIKALESKEAEWRRERKARIRAATRHATVAVNAAKKLSKGAPDIPGLESRVAEFRKQQAESKKWQGVADLAARERDTTARADLLAQTALESAAAELSKAAALLAAAKLAKENKCPLCGGPIAPEDAARHVAEATEAKRAAANLHDRRMAERKKTRAAAEAAQATYDAARKKRAEADEVVEELDGAVEQLAEGRNFKERVQRARERAQEELAAARALKEEINPHTAPLETARKKVASAQRDVDKARDLISEYNKDRAHLEFWARGFSPTGIPSFVLDSVMPMLTERANHYLDVLADGDIQMEFTSQRELRSSKGEFRDEIDIKWQIEGLENYSPSHGQWKKMEIATEFSLMDLVADRDGAAPNLLLLDECLDGLDAPGRERVLSLLHSLRKTRGTIMVISHEADMAEIFERSITVVKRDKVARLETS